MKIIDQSVKILRPSSPEEALCGLKAIEYAGRNCYRSQDKMSENSHERFISSLIKRGHGSPLEFEDMTVEIVTSRDVLAEITRHRLASFAVQSQRYVLDDKDGDIEFIKPDYYIPQESLSLDAKKWCASRNWEQNVQNAENDYKYQIQECGMSPQDARKILPNSTKTIIVMKANIREWLHIFELRNSPAAYPEMRTMISMIINEFQRLYPGLYSEKE
ncbi:MAG: FAD-dependent thymidylate synthase [Clostridia bacterium]|nr:FAD-dependent thymidylate synthase [Clostridia bacterium]